MTDQKSGQITITDMLPVFRDTNEIIAIGNIVYWKYEDKVRFGVVTGYFYSHKTFKVAVTGAECFDSFPADQCYTYKINATAGIDGRFMHGQNETREEIRSGVIKMGVDALSTIEALNEADNE